MIASKRIGAVFCTMNRREVAATCLRKLSGQTRLPDRVVVTDNASTDGTAEVLRELEIGGLPFAFELLEPGGNLGNAGGVQLAMERAFERGADAVWILDDDSWPEPEALEQLLDPRGPQGVRSSMVLVPQETARDERQMGSPSGEPSTPVGQGTGPVAGDESRPTERLWEEERLSWPLQVPQEVRPEDMHQDLPAPMRKKDRAGAADGWRLVRKRSQLPKEGWCRVRRSWLGALVPREVYETIGPVRGDLFLRGEDEDYPRRMERAGYETWLALGSVLRHPLGGELNHLKIGGQTAVLEKGLEGDKLYYRLRNMVWMAKKERGSGRAAVLALCYAWLVLRDGKSSLGDWRQAVWDAWRGKLGKRDSG